jgi:hypothetical protein
MFSQIPYCLLVLRAKDIAHNVQKPVDAFNNWMHPATWYGREFDGKVPRSNGIEVLPNIRKALNYSFQIEIWKL